MLVPKPLGVNIARSLLLFKKKCKEVGSLDQYKARLVSNGKLQRPGINYDETFIPIVKPATICMALNLAISTNGPFTSLILRMLSCMVNSMRQYICTNLLVYEIPNIWTMCVIFKNLYMVLSKPTGLVPSLCHIHHLYWLCSQSL